MPNSLNFYEFVWLHHHRIFFFENVVGSFCATCTATGYPCFHVLPLEIQNKSAMHMKEHVIFLREYILMSATNSSNGRIISMCFRVMRFCAWIVQDLSGFQERPLFPSPHLQIFTCKFVDHIVQLL